MSDKNHPDPGPGHRIASGDDWKDERCEMWSTFFSGWIPRRNTAGSPFDGTVVYRIPDDQPQPEPVAAVEPAEAEPSPDITPQQAIAALSKAMQEDSDFAWAWHSNIAMVAWDAGAPICEANERAADFIKHAFGVDMRASEQWKNMPMPAVDTVTPDDNHSTTHDPVYHPEHYTQGPIECVDWVRLGLTPEEYRGWLKGTSMGYLFRERLKGGDEDLAKAAEFLTFHRRPTVNVSP